MSVIVLTHNELVNIEACLQSLSAFDELVVVDSGSTDGTLDVLRDHYPNVRVQYHRFSDFGQQRNWALENSNARNEWVLFFDADERCDPDCEIAIANAIKSLSGHDGYFLCYRNMFLGRWIRRSTLFPTWQLRLLRQSRVRYRKEGHGQREVMDGTAGYILAPYDHFGFSKGIKEWIARHNEYSTNEVELIRRLARTTVHFRDFFDNDPVVKRRALKCLAARIPLRPLARFCYLYILRGGFLDGYPGVIFCLLRAAHEVHIVAKLSESGGIAASCSDAVLCTAASEASARSTSREIPKDAPRCSD